MHKPNAGLVSSCIIEVMKDRHKKVKHVTALQKYDNDNNYDGNEDVGNDDGDEVM